MMNNNDIIYISLLLLSVLLGHAIKRLNHPMHRLLFSGMIGFLMALFICGSQIWHSLFVSTVILLITKFVSKRYRVLLVQCSNFEFNNLFIDINSVCHIVGFSFAFGYLLFFRSTSWFGLEYPFPLTNAIQLLLTLKA